MKGSRDVARKNERIRAPRVRVIMPNGEQLGVMSARDALIKAKGLGLDLVEIAAKADPPVCKIVDYGKWKYEQSKLRKGQKSKAATKMKELKFRVRTEQHDYNIKLARAEKFLDEGHKLRVQLQFRGRENAHREIGFEVMQRVVGDLKTMGQVDQEPRLNGRAIVMILSPLPEHKRKPRFTKFHVEELEDEDDHDEDDHDQGEQDEGEQGGDQASGGQAGQAPAKPGSQPKTHDVIVDPFAV
jgi:translation initiation factor IF-3